MLQSLIQFTCVQAGVWVEIQIVELYVSEVLRVTEFEDTLSQ